MPDNKISTAYEFPGYTANSGLVATDASVGYKRKSDGVDAKYITKKGNEVYFKVNRETNVTPKHIRELELEKDHQVKQYGAVPYMGNSMEPYPHKLQGRRFGFSEQYNCHGLTFLRRLGWIPNLQAKNILQDEFEKYGEITKKDYDSLAREEWDNSQRSKLFKNVKPGDVVAYYRYDPDTNAEDLTHTARVVQVKDGRVWVHSKCAKFPEYIHELEKYPFYVDGNRIELYREQE